jgi:hypothetical protein
VIPWQEGRPVSLVPLSAADLHAAIPPVGMVYWMITPVISHELAEACTDPYLDGWWDSANQHQEVADIPISLARAWRVSYADVF